MKNIKIGLLLTALMGLFGAVGDVCGMEEKKISAVDTINNKINGFLDNVKRLFMDTTFIDYSNVKNTLDSKEYVAARKDVDLLKNYIEENKQKIKDFSQDINTDIIFTIEQLDRSEDEFKDILIDLQQIFKLIMDIKNTYTSEEASYFAKLISSQEDSRITLKDIQTIIKMIDLLKIPKTRTFTGFKEELDDIHATIKTLITKISKRKDFDPAVSKLRDANEKIKALAEKTAAEEGLILVRSPEEIKAEVVSSIKWTNENLNKKTMDTALLSGLRSIGIHLDNSITEDIFTRDTLRSIENDLKDLKISMKKYNGRFTQNRHDVSYVRHYRDPKKAFLTLLDSLLEKVKRSIDRKPKK